MFAQIIKDHQEAQQARTEKNDAVRREAIEGFADVSRSLVKFVNSGVVSVHSNQKQIEAQTKTLQVQTQKYVRQVEEWVQLIDRLNQSLKELGDVEHWAHIIENDLQTVASTLEDVRSLSVPAQPPSQRR